MRDAAAYLSSSERGVFRSVGGMLVGAYVLYMPLFALLLILFLPTFQGADERQHEVAFVLLSAHGNGRRA